MREPYQHFNSPYGSDLIRSQFVFAPDLTHTRPVTNSTTYPSDPQTATPYADAIARRASTSVAELSKGLENYRAGETGLLRLTWDNGDRTVLVNPELGGVTFGWNLLTTAQDELFAAIEGGGTGPIWAEAGPGRAGSLMISSATVVAGAIAGEKERKSYEMLLASPLAPGALSL